jgi:hypothetical protein
VQKQVLGQMVSSVLSFDIVTYPFKFKVRRTSADFKVLRDYLLKKFPQTLAPPLPRINARKKLTVKQLLKKQGYYHRFLECVLNSQLHRAGEFLVEFLKEGNLDEFKVKSLAAQMEEPPKKITEFLTLGGDIDVNALKKARDFCENFDSYVNSHSEITS